MGCRWVYRSSSSSRSTGSSSSSTSSRSTGSRSTGSAAFSALLISAIGVHAVAAGAEPLDLQDPSPRLIQAAFPGVTVTASYTVQAGSGIVSLSAESHELIRPHFLQPVPGSFTPLTLTIALADGSGTSSQASGAWQSGVLSEAFTQDPLSTEVLAGYMQGNNLPPLYCTSQQAIDDFCLIQPIFCGVVCVPVAGSRYDPGTGQIALVGSEQVQGCDGGVCFGPYAYFSLLEPILSEVETPAVPALGSLGRIALGIALLATSALPIRRGRGS